MTRTPSVAILIATYRREHLLLETLASLDRTKTSQSFAVIIVDNDSEGRTAERVRGMQSEWSFQVTAVCEPQPGIAAARNRALDEALDYDIVCFIDDDETVSEDWLEELVAPILRGEADAVSGPVDSVFEAPIPQWAHLGKFFTSEDTPEGARVGEAATNNLAIRRASLMRGPVTRFDSRFSESGGSDIFLTQQLAAAGIRIVWTNAARVTERVPASRCSADWIRTRAVRGGNTHGRVALMRPDNGWGRPESLRRRLAVAVRGGVRVLAGAGAVVTSPGVNRSARAARGYRTLLRGVGFLRAALNRDVLEYKRSS
ncbi:glycosyltransferase family 2 protein [Microbacterium paludicola]|uniref:glycosyltransferase family 2 protein n=1 Tax=Microbacterium paludicola TaxID=300019 RepID=UPI0009031928|nr:glycosyltransferase family 2 protein [Microbacterium paludicola]APF35086.1 hypothetical protein BO218_13500 [Microbacterium paludicola]